MRRARGVLAVCRSLAACQRKGVCWQYAHCMYKGMQNTRAYTRAQNTRACRIREHIQGHAEYKGMQNTRAYTRACRIHGHIQGHAKGYIKGYAESQHAAARMHGLRRTVWSSQGRSLLEEDALGMRPTSAGYPNKCQMSVYVFTQYLCTDACRTSLPQ